MSREPDSKSEPTTSADPRRRRVSYVEEEVTSYPPTRDDVEEWAERERRRRQAWLEGPSEEERHEWARREYEHRGGEGARALWPADEEVKEWAERERRRRQAWLEGPSEEERREWARRERRRREQRDWYDGPGDWDEDPSVARLRRDVQLAAEGAARILWEWPFWTWSRLVRAGRDHEERFNTPFRTRRITYYD
ncbi:MAG TPA: hypothetical protein VJ866_04025 [Pyrinomonadaceae bacterium]|nr:hypothetical protein [Pyrinomonadaceae bacterium]